ETMTGRIYRVAPVGGHPVAPKLDLKTTAGCVAALQSPNLSTRYLAWTKLHAAAGAAEGDLVGLWKGQDPRMRARALQLLARIPGREHRYIEQALKDPDADLRITGLRITCSLKRDVIPAIKQLVRDSSAAVRRECALSLRHSHSPDAPQLWAQLAQQYDGPDR